MKSRKSKFLPDSVSGAIRALVKRVVGALVLVFGIWALVALLFHNSFLDGFGCASTFGDQSFMGNIVGFVRYVVGFIPSLFLILCVMRFGISMAMNWDAEYAPEYNVLRGFIAVCAGAAGFGMIAPNATYGGLLGSFVGTDVGGVIGNWCVLVGMVCLGLFICLGGMLLHIRWSHVQSVLYTAWRGVRWVLSAFHLIPPAEDEKEEYEEEEEEEEEEEAEDDEEDKPKQRRARATKKRAVAKRDPDEYELPPPELLEKSVFNKSVITPEMKQNAILLQDHFETFKIYGKVVGIKPGPVITQYEFLPEPGTRVDQVTTTAKDMTLAMAAEKIRISPITGTSYIGIEMENLGRKPIRYQSLMANELFVESKFAIPLALGVSIGGDPLYYDLAKMPHMLIAGRTGSGKSVFVQSLITSFVYHFTPDKGKLMIIDPKAVDFAVWEDIPHLITPIVTDANDAVNALKWAVRDMEERYKQLKKMAVRNIGEYNEKVRALREKGEVLTEQVAVGTDEETGELLFETKEMDLSDMPYLAVIIDEVADLMTVARKDVEMCVQRLAAKARAAGIHLVMATQRPSADVITGVIKSNFPTRISFQARSAIDSRTTLGEPGAEQLLSCGDMLFSEAGRPVVRIHAALIKDDELKRIADFWRAQGEPTYTEGVTSEVESDAGVVMPGAASGGKGDDLYSQAIEIVKRDKKPTISYLQRRLGIGYNKAASLMERMEADGIVSAPDANNKRQIL